MEKFDVKQHQLIEDAYADLLARRGVATHARTQVPINADAPRLAAISVPNTR
jgi:hypothetical protein